MALVSFVVLSARFRLVISRFIFAIAKLTAVADSLTINATIISNKIETLITRLLCSRAHFLKENAGFSASTAMPSRKRSRSSGHGFGVGVTLVFFFLQGFQADILQILGGLAVAILWGGVGGSFTTFISTVITSLPGNGKRPVIISYSMAPNE